MMDFFCLRHEEREVDIESTNKNHLLVQTEEESSPSSQDSLRSSLIFRPVSERLCYYSDKLSDFESLAQAKLFAYSLSNFFFKIRTRQGPIRTSSLIPVRIKIACYEAIPLYQILSPKIKQLKALGMSNEDIAKKLNVNRKTVGKGLNW